jgi:dephospho-CoA kinase
MSSPRASCPSEAAHFVVGLTGGIGSGKSTVAARLQDLGAGIVDTDVIAHRLTAPGGAAMPAIAQAFGPDYVAADGSLDRARMRTRVFGEQETKRRLESILHPLIREATDAATRQHAQRAPYVVVVVPLLVESGGWRERVDRVLVVDCSERTQVERVRARSGLSAAEARSIIAQQATRQARLDAADDVIVNEADAASLPPRVARLHEQYLRCAAQQSRQAL